MLTLDLTQLLFALNLKSLKHLNKSIYSDSDIQMNPLILAWNDAKFHYFVVQLVVCFLPLFRGLLFPFTVIILIIMFILDLTILLYLSYW